MDSKTIFVRTDKGEEEIRGRSQSLSGDIRRALLMVDGSSSFAEISKRSAPSLRAILDDSFKELQRSGFIQDKARAAQAGNVPKMVVPVKTPPAAASRASPAMKQPSGANLDELDFTAAFRAPTPEALAAEGAKLEAERRKAEAQAEAMRLKAEQEAASARKEIEAAKLKVQQEAEAARLKAEQDAMKAREEAEQAKRLMAQAQAKAEAEARARKEIEAARSKAQQEAEAARRKAEQEAVLAREEAEAARLKAEQEAAQIRAELARAQAKAEAESRAYAEAAASARKEIEAVKLKAQQDAEAARLKAEQDSIAAREVAEQARRQAAEAARLKAEQEAAQARAELAEAQAKAEAEKARQQAAEAQARAEAEAVAHAEAEVRARKEIEAAKLMAQQETEALRLKAERDAVLAREEAITAREEAEQAKRQVAEAQARAEAEALAHAKTEAKVREEAETAKLKVQQEAEALRLKAEQDAAKARAEAEQAQRQAEAAALAREEVEQRAKAQAEEARLKAEQEAAQARAELAEAQAKAEAELSRRQAAEAEVEIDAEAAMLQVQQEVETARVKAEQDAEQLKRQAAEAKAQVHEDAGRKVQREADAARIEEASLKAEQEAQRLARMAATLKSAGAEYQRSTSATVLFFDVVGYTKQPVNKQIKIKKLFNQLVSDCLAMLGDDERIILDTGDGAAIGFLQHPEDALQVARQFREVVTGHQHKDYPELEVRTGIHLGPVSIVKDMNGQSNMVGDGINDAQRIMSFAGIDQIYISRPYYDFISRLSDEYAELFQYRGMQQDKHGREHAVYELVDPSVAEVAPRAGETLPPITLEPFVFAASEIGVASNAPPEQAEPIPQPEQVSGMFTEIKLMDMDEVSPPESPAVEAPPPAASVEQTAPPVQVEPPVRQEAKPVADAHMPSEEDVAAMAASQAKVWSKAEQRAAMKKKEQAVHAPQPAQREEKPVVRARRKPVPWGKVGAGLFVLMIAALFAMPFVLPMRDYAKGIEQTLAAQLKQPVHIGQVSGRILPMPRLELGDVSIGDAGQVSVKLARLDFAISALFSSTKAIDSLALDGVQVNGAVLQQLPDWLLQMAVDTQYPVGRVALSQGALQADGLQLSGIAGELNFDATGLFTQAKLHTADGKLALDIDAVAEGRMKAVISVRGSALPLLPAWTFDELIVTGELTRDRLIVSELDGSIMDGRLLGNLDISWADGWQANGDLIARVVTVQKLGTALSGDMDGSARFRMKADSLVKLVDSAIVEGSFVVSKGVVGGFDIVETTRLRSRESQPGGRTHFDELTGDLSFENGNYRFRRLRMKAGVLSATGSLDVANQQLSGQIGADLSMRSGSASAGLLVGGTTSVPTLRVR